MLIKLHIPLPLNTIGPVFICFDKIFTVQSFCFGVNSIFTEAKIDLSAQKEFQRLYLYGFLRQISEKKKKKSLTESLLNLQVFGLNSTENDNFRNLEIWGVLCFIQTLIKFYADDTLSKQHDPHFLVFSDY